MKWLLIDHYQGIETRHVWSKLVADHSKTILEPGFQSITSKIRDEDFYRGNYQEDFSVNDEHDGFFKTAKGLKVTRAAKKTEGKNGATIRNNNGAVLREVLFLELIYRKYMFVGDDGNVEIKRPQ